MEGRSGKNEGEAVDDGPPWSEVDGPLPADNRLSYHHPTADRPPLHPPPNALHDHSSSLPVAMPQVSGLVEGNSATDTARSGVASSGSPKPSPGHRRSQSDAVVHGSNRGNSFRSFKSQIQRAWKWGGSSQQEIRKFSFNPEVLADQKREWHQLQSKSTDRTTFKEPTALFEHLIVTGLHPDVNLEAVEQAFARKKKWESAMARTMVVDLKHEYLFSSPPPLEPKMLFKYPPGKKLPMRSKDLCAFCFPGGVKASMVERTPSLSDLNELIYGQGHLGRDDLAFVFSAKGADNASLYGVCLLVPEIVQRSPSILGGSSPLCHDAASRFLVSAPRCYCLLTRVPFFELHFEVLNSIVSQERLNRITQFVSEITVNDHDPSNWRSPKHSNRVTDSSFRNCFTDWMSSAIPVDSAVFLIATAAGMVADDFKEAYSSPSAAASEAFSGPTYQMEIDERKSSHCYDDDASNGLDQPACERSYNTPNYDGRMPGQSILSHSSSGKMGRSASTSSLFSLEKSHEDDDNSYLSSSESDFSGDLSDMDWAKENKNDFVKVLRGYNALPVPAPGCEIVFQPLEHLQAIRYRRPAVYDIGLEAYLPELESHNLSVPAEVSAKLAAAEEAASLSVWTTATLCRVLSLDNILALIAGVLLEKQVVITCPNLGVLSAVVLSLVPIIRPFEWQSLLLPVLPEKLLDFLDAPVPFLVGIVQKPIDFALRNSNLVYIDVLKDQQKMCNLPFLPRYEELYAKLRLIHDKLLSEKSDAQKQHVYRYCESQVEASTEFLVVMRRYMESLCEGIRFNAITSVQSNDRVSVLLKDSFIDSFSETDQPFVKLFIETQMFSVLSDYRLSAIEHEHG